MQTRNDLSEVTQHQILDELRQLREMQRISAQTHTGVQLGAKIVGHGITWLIVIAIAVPLLTVLLYPIYDMAISMLAD